MSSLQLTSYQSPLNVGTNILLDEIDNVYVGKVVFFD